VTNVQHKDGTSIGYTYEHVAAGSQVTITDEEQFDSVYTYNSFGNPDEAYLMSVKDAKDYVTTYNYNISGAWPDYPGSLVRTFDYQANNGALLEYETHPEKGMVHYERDNLGNVRFKTDGMDGPSINMMVWTV